MTEVGTIRVSQPNHASTLAHTVIPLPPGAWTPKTSRQLYVGDEPARAVQVGPAHEDGSARWAQLLWRESPGDGVQVARVVDPKTSSFVFHPDIAKAAMRGWRFGLTGFETPHVWWSEPVDKVGTHYTLGYRAGTRWARIELLVCSFTPIVRWWVRWGFSLIGSEARFMELTPLQLSYSFVRCAVFDEHKVLSHEHSHDERHGTILLDGGGRIADGQSQLLTGYLDFSPASTPLVECSALSEQWGEISGLGPFNYIPDVDWLAEPGDEAREWTRGAPRPRAPWGEAPFTSTARPGQTGDDEDFGLLPRYAVVAIRGRHPEALRSWRANIYQEACRPVHFMEDDLEPFRVTNHPRCFMWDERPHQDPAFDTLGKKDTIAEWDTRKTPRGTGWWGRDRQHYSVNNLCSYAMLSGDPLALELVDEQVERWIAAHPVDSGNPTLDGQDSPRGVGRSLYAGSWLYLTTGRQDLLGRLHERCQRLTSKEAGGWHSFAVHGPSQASGAIDVQHWRPWENAIAVFGAAAAGELASSTSAKTLALAVGNTVVVKGYRGDPFDMATAMEWRDGTGPNPDVAKWAAATGAGYRLWGASCLRLIELASTGAVKERAAMLLDKLRATLDRKGFPSWIRWTALP